MILITYQPISEDEHKQPQLCHFWELQQWSKCMACNGTYHVPTYYIRGWTASIMPLFLFIRTSEGHELQFGTNHLGPFLLTKLLLPLLRKAPAARYVIGMVGCGKVRYGMVYLSIFLLTKLLLPLLRNAPTARYSYIFFTHLFNNIVMIDTFLLLLPL